MNLEQLLTASAKGLPMVKSNTMIKGATSDIGKVVVIKDNGRFKGCAVQFPGLNYDTWFTDDSNGTDKRSHYMHELKLSD